MAIARTLLGLLAVASSLIDAAPLDERAAVPTVTVSNGTILGTSVLGVDSFKGIPFALPPTGSLRLKPPQSYNQKYPGGIFTSVAIPTACPQFQLQADTSNVPESALALLADSPLAQAITVSGEDCLTLNVQRPTGTTASSKLPVIFWIYGGGFEFGSTQTYDGSSLLLSSVALSHPVIFVAVNYRVAGFGFLAGKEVQTDGSTNLGLRDQRLGLEWVAENIAAFGGDPTKVTIYGESAGAISVLDQTIINGGDNTYKGQALFRGAIMDSGSIVPAEDVTTPKAQTVYNTVVANAGCSRSADTLACLRTVSYTTFLNAVNSVPNIFSYRSLDLSYLPRPDPSSSFFSTSPDAAIKSGSYAKVPIIIGDQEDEGTLFSLIQANITTIAQLTTYLESYFPVSGAAQVPGLVATYTDETTDGSPFRTSILNEIYPQFKRLAAILGDVTFNLARRGYLANVAGTVNAWSYLDSHLYGTPVLGTFHASDILEIYEDIPDVLTATAYHTYVTSFANYLNPNTITTAAPLIEWPQYTAVGDDLLQFNALTNGLTPDTYRQASYEYLAANSGIFKV